MAESALHQEARRLQANLDKKQEALKRHLAQQSQKMCGELDYTKAGSKSATMFSGADNFDTKSSGDVLGPPMHRIYHRKADNNPVDKVYPLLHPQGYFNKTHQRELPRKPHFKV
ncbi:uncharacterized protein LOC117327974 isoform X5 [Pecten maximus]|uniref:uncharacterized protein LOC117327974 isoform X5 n=1 Tax=Pecten maximus TaxID=6579 RepID=UPI001458770C|nr:uncharacterized protein LOC117327974 isoform X5 [Pecten maximus]